MRQAGSLYKIALPTPYKPCFKLYACLNLTHFTVDHPEFRNSYQLANN